MKFSINTKTFKEALSRINLLPNSPEISSNFVKLVNHVEGIELHRNTPNASILTGCESKGTKQGSIVADINLLLPIIERIKAEEIELVSNEKELLISSPSTKAKVHLVPEDEFPQELTGRGSIVPMAFLAEDLTSWISGAALAAERTDNNKYVLQSVTFRTLKEKVYIIGTDGKRIHFCETPCSLKVDTSIPIALADVVARVLRTEQGRVTVLAHENIVTFEAADSKLTVSRLEGVLPDVSKFLESIQSDKPEASADIEKKTLKQAIEVVEPAAFNPDKIGGWKVNRVHLRFNRGSISLFADNEKGAQITHQVECNIKGSAECDVSATLLANAINFMPDEEIGLDFSAKTQALFLRNKDRRALLCILRNK